MAMAMIIGGICNYNFGKNDKNWWRWQGQELVTMVRTEWVAMVMTRIGGNGKNKKIDKNNNYNKKGGNNKNR